MKLMLFLETFKFFLLKLALLTGAADELHKADRTCKCLIY